MYSSKENLKFPSPSHFKTPYSRVSNRAQDLIVSKILNKTKTSENDFGRRLFPEKPPKVFEENFDWGDEALKLSLTCRYGESVRNPFEGEPVHFRPRKSQLKTKPNENNFDNYLELKMMNLGDGEDVLGNCKKSNKKPEPETQSKGFQIKQRQNLCRIFTGSVENVLHWSKLKNSHEILFEVTATMSTVQNGKWKSEKVFHLSDPKSGFRLQVVFYEIDRPFPNLCPNSLVTCIGRLMTRNRLQAYKVEESSEEKKNDLQRLSFICNRVADELVAVTLKK